MKIRTFTTYIGKDEDIQVSRELGEESVICSVTDNLYDFRNGDITGSLGTWFT